MTRKEAIKAPGRSQEEEYFRKREMEAIERLRQEKARRAEREAIADIIESRDPKVLSQLEVLEFNRETVGLLHLLPLVQMAWADDRVHPGEMTLILDLGRSRGIERGSESERLLTDWLRNRPTESFFRDALEVIRELLASRPAEVRRATTKQMIELCIRVAAASGGLFGMGEKTSDQERKLLSRLTESFGAPTAGAGSSLN